MFEDSTFESANRIKTKSGRWMLLTGGINLSILVLLVLIPLIYPEALPSALISSGTFGRSEHGCSWARSARSTACWRDIRP